MKINLWITLGKWDVKNVNKDVIEITANDVPRNGGILRALLKIQSYCHKIDKKVEL